MSSYGKNRLVGLVAFTLFMWAGVTFSYKSPDSGLSGVNSVPVCAARAQTQRVDTLPPAPTLKDALAGLAAVMGTHAPRRGQLIHHK